MLAGMKKANRYLIFRGKSWRYERNTPLDVRHLDPRGTSIRVRLTARSAQEARKQRDALAISDDALWAALRAGEDAATAWQRYDAQRQLHLALGMEPVDHEAPFNTLPREQRQAHLRNVLKAVDMVTGDDFKSEEELAKAVERTGLDSHPIYLAGIGSAKKVSVTLSDALRQFVEDSALANRSKSTQQQRKWEERRRRGVNNFIAVCGDLEMERITRDHALRLHTFWRDRILRENISADMATKTFSALRAVYRNHFDRLGEMHRQNPFDGLSFPDVATDGRLPFTVDWIRARFLRGDALAGLNNEARAILLVLVETGCRPSEVCNLVPEAIQLEDDIPHIDIAPRRDREIKSKTSRRKLPLVGVALEAMRQHPNGFPRYRDREDTLSATLMKYVRENGLRENDRQSVYSLRHSYVDRLRAAGIGDDLRRAITGHAVGDSHSGYGRGFGLEIMREAMASIALPFDPGVVG